MTKIRKLIDLEEDVIEKLKKQTKDTKSKSLKRYMEETLSKEANRKTKVKRLKKVVTEKTNK